ncbi:MAG: type 2 lantipeptide synthetase LanM family protein [Scytonematopsis contorta HA4267-MV1]|jgi:type 2 lantibiotic biosynthesis protein LanM|nr:type 2 lantipeptide synthetase LanM family protein [Scytonematopsis contorta HA4267-MV1]
MLTSNKFALTQSALTDIVAQASPLSERLNHNLFGIDATEANKKKLSDEHLNYWCQVVASGNWEKFQKRLRWAGWNIDTVRSATGTVKVMDTQTLPGWATTLKEIIQTAHEQSIKNLKFEAPIDPKKPVPFEDLLLPACFVARQKLLTRLGFDSLSPDCLPLELLSKEAYLAIERSLLSNLLNLCEKTLELEFSHFRPLGESLLNILLKETKATPNKTYYQEFVQKLLKDGLLSFFQKYPVLGRLIATRIDFWVEATAEFLQYLKADKSEIEQAFIHSQSNVDRVSQSQIELGKVVEIKSNLSDLHKGGRCVIALTFESGLKLVYKPRNLSLEVAFNELLEWCNQQDVLLHFKILKVLNRPTYGWVEYVEQQPCENEAAARRFYQRAGMLLCLLYTLGGNDCHHENLIASGEHLVLIDMETLMHPEQKHLEDFPQATVQMVSNEKFWNDSVLRTGLLPCWDINKDNRIVYDISGLGSIDPQASPWRLLQWKSVNTDNMHQVYQTVTIPVAKNVAILNGMPLSPNDYLEELVEGFRKMYHFLIDKRQFLLGKPSPLATLQAQSVRFIFRATKVYGILLQKTLTPELLQNGIDRSIEMDILARAFLTTENQPKAWSILHSELRAMEQLDIPYFETNSNSDNLTFGLDRPIEEFFVAPSYNQVLSRLQKLDEADLAQQLAIIQGAFYARVARSISELPSNGQPFAVSTLCKEEEQSLSVNSEQLLASADTIAAEIYSKAIVEADGSVYWIALSYIPNVERFQLQPLDESLYSGNCGIALFLAALDYLRGSSQYRHLALGALQYTCKVLQSDNADLTQRFAKNISIGGASGLGSIIYSLVKISHFLKEPALVEDALLFAKLITPELIAADQQLDVMGGAAGAILGLLALYHKTGEKTVLDKAVACGQHLLEHRISINGSPKTWKSFENKPLTGFSHGAAGIAYALLRLYSVTQDSNYLEAASDGIAYESSVFSTKAANWPDFRSFTQQNGQPGFNTVSWCHGATGIGLGRLGGLSILETSEIHQDIEVALQTTHSYSLQGVDHLCCGNLGRCEVLLLGAQKLSRPELLTMAQQKAAWVLARAKLAGGYQLFANLPNHVFNPGFFQGTAGIGYELLRLAYPEALPSVLLWE